MKSVTHEEQRERWEREHSNPTVLLQMDTRDVSSGVSLFAEWLREQDSDLNQREGLEICCGKGRNTIWLAHQSVSMTGLDFSAVAIAEANKRSKESNMSEKVSFSVHDVTLPFPVEENSQDFAIDCFGSTDIESSGGRKSALNNTIAVLKPGGYLFVYLMSTDDEFHKEMIVKHPGPDEGSFLHPDNGKYEKVFSEEEVRSFYADLNLIELRRIPKQATFFDSEYACNHIWAVFQKPFS